MMFIANFVIGKKAAFYMNIKVKTQNVRHYAPLRYLPDFTYDKNISRTRITSLGRALWNRVILGPFFIKRDLNGNSYLRLVDRQVIPAFRSSARKIPSPLGDTG